MSGLTIALIVVGVLLVLIIAVVAWIICVHNSLVKLRNNVKESFSTMDVYLKKRYDLVPNLVETVKGYAKHESATLKSVMEARNSAMNANSTQEKVKSENALTQTLGKLIAVAESYPDLKANQNFLALQNQLSSLEDDIASSRKYYNGCVKMFNNKIEVFPNNLIAGKLKFEKFDLFEVEDKKQRENVQVKF